MDDRKVIVECHSCRARVQADVQGKADAPWGDGSRQFIAVIATCCVCEELLFGISELEEIAPGRFEFRYATRFWPEPPRRYNSAIPKPVSLRLQEAALCLDAGAYASCAIMCRSAVEEICKRLLGKKYKLQTALKEAKKQGALDQHLHDWGESLRLAGNFAAHEGTSVSRQDARDLFDFADALSEYIFVVRKKHEKFQERQKRITP